MALIVREQDAVRFVQNRDLHRGGAYINAKKCIGIAEKYIGIAKKCIGIADKCIGIAMSGSFCSKFHAKSSFLKISQSQNW
nr:hypothetical protein [uncultured Acetatifactor sp.]